MEPAAPAPKLDLLGLPLEQLTRLVADELGERPFHARQLYRWIHQRGVTDFEAMTDLSKALRAKLRERCGLEPLAKDLEQRSSDGTIKYRFRTHDGRLIETRLHAGDGPEDPLRLHPGRLCHGLQVLHDRRRWGCCATSLPPRSWPRCTRSTARCAQNEGLAMTRPLTNLVFMGMGEPLHNFDNLKDALHILQSEDGPNFSHRHITVSTVGLVPMIARLGAETDVKLAISLNASTDAQRDELMPVNRKWKIADLMEACRQFPLRQGRRITFEYVLLRGVNDADEDAERLIDAAPRRPGQGEPHPLQREPRPRLLHHRRGPGRALPRDPRPGPRGGLHPREPGTGHRRRLRPAGQPPGPRVSRTGGL